MNIKSKIRCDSDMTITCKNCSKELNLSSTVRRTPRKMAILCPYCKSELGVAF